MKNLKYFLPGAVLITSLALAGIVYANPFYQGLSAQTAIATSTQVYMTPGAATTTPIYDSYEQYGTNETNGGNLTVANQVAVLLNGAASSTATVVNVTCEFSNNYNGTTGNGDWYQNEIIGATTTNAGVQSIGPVNGFSFTYASTTVGGAPLPSATFGKFAKVIVCPVPLRFVRAVITMTGANGSVWSSIVPIKQRS